MQKNLPLVLVILDGWGIAPPSLGNAITQAKTEHMDLWWRDFPHTQLEASGTAVGLLPGQVGNSEAGHLNLGAGQVVEQDILRIHEAIDSGIFFHNAAFEHAYQHALQNHSKIHLMGLLSNDQSGHSHPRHLQALIEFFRLRGVKNIYLHLFTDGRDTPQQFSKVLVQRLLYHLQPGEKIVTLAGRLYLDRKKDWLKTEKLYNTLVINSEHSFTDPEEYLVKSYQRGITDEFVEPAVLVDQRGNPVGRIKDKDAIVFFNLRSDRARQLTKPFVQNDFRQLNPGSFKRKRVLKKINFVAMTDFGPDLENILTAFPSPDIKDTLPVALKHLRQYYLAESEKFAHITYFFNGGYEDPVAGEQRYKVESPGEVNYAHKPEMSATEIVSQARNWLKNKQADFIALNLANADMVAHSGNLAATIKACEAVDKELARLYQAVKSVGGTMIVTADHGNAECLINQPDGSPNTEHDASLVPFIVLASDAQNIELHQHGVLADVAPTILDWLAIDKPASMTGQSLIKK